MSEKQNPRRNQRRGAQTSTEGDSGCFSLGSPIALPFESAGVFGQLVYISGGEVSGLGGIPYQIHQLRAAPVVLGLLCHGGFSFAVTHKLWGFVLITLYDRHGKNAIPKFIAWLYQF